MALTLALPLSGLNPENFSTLNAKLLQVELERNPPVGRDSPSTASDSSGISSYIASNTSSVEITPTSSRPVTPIRLIDQKKNEEKRNNIMIIRDKFNQNKKQDKENEDEIMYNGRNILKLGPNIRPTTIWQPPSSARPDRQIIMRERNKEEKNIKETPPCNVPDCKFSINTMLNIIID